MRISWIVVCSLATCACRLGFEFPDQPGSDALPDDLDCTPELGWFADFDNDPTALDVNGDGQGDWRRRDGTAFDTGQLEGGVWNAPSYHELDTVPKFNFATPTVADVRMRATDYGERGAVFWINADYSDADQQFAALFVQLVLQPDNSQHFRLQGKTDDATEFTMAELTGLSGDFHDVHMVLDTRDDTVTVSVDGQVLGPYPYPRFDPGGDDRFATVLGYGVTAEFEYARVRICR